MRHIIAAALLAASTTLAIAQTANPPANPNPSTPAIGTKDQHTGAPAAGANSFTEGQAKSRIESAGFTNVTGLTKDKDGVWRGKGMKSGTAQDVSLDYQGNIVGK